MSAKKIISEALKVLLISLVDHDDYIKIKLELAIDVVNIEIPKLLTPYELFILGKTLGRLHTIQLETSYYDISEHEITLAIDEIESMLKKH